MERLENSILNKMILAMQTVKELCGEFDSVMEEMQLEFLKELKQYRDTGLTPEQIREIDRLYAEKCRELAEVRDAGK